MSETVGFAINGKNLTVRVEANDDTSLDLENLKVEAIIAILDTIDYKDYFNAGKEDEIENTANRIIRATKRAFGLNLSS